MPQGERMPEDNFYALLLELRNAIERAFKDALSRIPAERMAEEEVVYDPPYDLIDLGDTLLLIMDLPGFGKDSIRIRAHEDFIEIRARAKPRELELKGRYLVRQRLVGRVEKRIRLPVKIKPHGVKAVLRSGTLEVYMPKAEIEKEVDIAIE